jgi:hypothetical protein
MASEMPAYDLGSIMLKSNKTELQFGIAIAARPLYDLSHLQLIGNILLLQYEVS